MSNSISEIQKFVQDTLNSLLGSLNDGFADNELAYLSSQGKNELQVRDKIAWLLHCEVTKNFTRESNGGLYFEDYFEFEGCTNYLLNHKETANRMGQNGREYVIRNFDWNVITRRYREFFEKIEKRQQNNILE